MKAESKVIDLMVELKKSLNGEPQLCECSHAVSQHGSEPSGDACDVEGCGCEGYSTAVSAVCGIAMPRTNPPGMFTCALPAGHAEEWHDTGMGLCGDPNAHMSWRDESTAAPTRESIKALVHEMAVSETLYIQANKRNEDAARQRFRTAAKKFEAAIDDLLARVEQAEKDLARYVALEVRS